MADLATQWLGLSLRSPLVLAASPLSRDPDTVRAAVDAGAGAVVMHSLFEEQIVHEQMAVHRFVDARVDADAEARAVLGGASLFAVDAGPYLREIERLRTAIDVPVVASLNGATPGGWTAWARRLESAGAHAIELNLYDIATDPAESGAALEERQRVVVQSVVQSVSIPVTVKLSAFYASVPAFVRALEGAGAKGVAVFNRYYQPDLNLDTLEVDRHIVLSTSAELPLRLHALAVLSASSRLSLACTGGVHTGLDAAKAILSGAHVVQLASVLLQRGPAHLAALQAQLVHWLDDKGYTSSAEARGVLDLRGAPDPHGWERLNYTRMLDGWRERTT